MAPAASCLRCGSHSWRCCDPAVEHYQCTGCGVSFVPMDAPAGFRKDILALDDRVSDRKAEVHRLVANGSIPLKLLNSSLALVDDWFLLEAQLLKIEWGVPLNKLDTDAGAE